MLIEEFLVGHERGDKDPVLQRQIAGDMGNHRFDYALGVVFFEPHE